MHMITQKKNITFPVALNINIAFLVAYIVFTIRGDFKISLMFFTTIYQKIGD